MVLRSGRPPATSHHFVANGNYYDQNHHFLKRILTIMTTPFMSPCTDHDNCPLDLQKLKIEIKAANQPDPRGEELWKEIDRLNAKRKDVAILKEPESMKKVDGDIKDAWAKYHQWQQSRTSDYRTILYSIRAHHRGRLHRQKVRCHDGSMLKYDLELQGQEFNNTNWGRVLNKFLKTPVATPNQAA